MSSSSSGSCSLIRTPAVVWREKTTAKPSRTPASATVRATSSVTSANSRWRSVCTVRTRVIVRKGSTYVAGAPGATCGTA